MNNKTPNTMKHICTVLFLFGTLSSFAQKKWSLKECVDHALEHNISVKQSVLDIDLATQDVVNAKGNFMPSLSASASQNFNLDLLLDKTVRESKVIQEGIILG